MQTILKRPRYQVALHPGGKAMFIIIMGEKTTDGAPGLEPLQRLPIRDGNGEVNYYEEANDSLERLWRQKLGRYLYKHVVMDELRKEGLLGVSSRRFDSRPHPYAHASLSTDTVSPDKVYLAALPQHYSLWVHKKGDPHDPRTDTYLHGEPLHALRCY